MDQNRRCLRATDSNMKPRDSKKFVTDQNQRSHSPWKEERHNIQSDNNQIVPDPSQVEERKSTTTTTTMPIDTDVTSIHFGPILQNLTVQSTTIPVTQPVVPTEGLSIIGFDSVIIPRRFKEGTKQIFDRVELHESIRRRIELDKLHGTGDGTLEEEPQINKQTTTVILPATLPLEPQPSSSSSRHQQPDRDLEKSHRSARSTAQSHELKTRGGRGGHKRKVSSRSPPQMSPTPSSSSVSPAREGEAHDDYLVRERKRKRLERFGNARRGGRKFQHEDMVHRPTNVLHIDFMSDGGLPFLAGLQGQTLHKVLFGHFAKLGPSSKLLSVKKYRPNPKSAWLVYDSIGDAMRARESIQTHPIDDKIFKFFDVERKEQYEIPYRVEYSNKIHFD